MYYRLNKILEKQNCIIKKKEEIDKITDEVISELDVITCNIDERMHDPPRKIN